MAHGRARGDPAGPGPDDTGCHILHVDMDAFYASVEIRDRPELAGQAGHRRAARAGAAWCCRPPTRRAAFGVRSAMPMGRAPRLCPQAVVIPPRHGLYGAVSREVMAVFRAITPEVEPLSLDEAFLDVSGARRRLGMRPAEIGRLIRAQVGEQQEITCSVGIATNKFVAKLASVHCKPDGLLVIPADGVLDFLHPLPVVGAVGRRAADRPGAGPARAAHGRGHRAHPGRRPGAGPRPGGGGPPVAAWPQGGTTAGWNRSARRRASVPRRPSPRTSATPR